MSCDLRSVWSRLPVPPGSWGAEGGGREPGRVSRMLESKAWGVALQARGGEGPSSFVVMRRIATNHRRGAGCVARMERTPAYVVGLNELEEWLAADWNSHRDVGATGAAAELYVGQDVLERIPPADCASLELSVVKRLGGLSVTVTARPPFVELTATVTATAAPPRTLPLRHAIWALSQSPWLSIVSSKSSSKPLSLQDYFDGPLNWGITPPPPSTAAAAAAAAAPASTSTSTSTAKKKPSKAAAAQTQLRIHRLAESLPHFETSDLLTSTNSVLTHLQLKDVINFRSFVRDLDAADRATLYAMLPAPDTRTAEGVEATLDRNVHFITSLALYQSLLRTGCFDALHVGKARNKRRRMEGWTDEKERQVEAFYGQKLEPKPAQPHEIARWKDLDEEVLKRFADSNAAGGGGGGGGGT